MRLPYLQQIFKFLLDFIFVSTASIHFIQQANEEDCGPACLAMIAKHYGKFFTINSLRAFVGTVQNGTTLFGLKQGAEAIGFTARAVKAPIEVIDTQAVPLPGIIHWQGTHWVVLLYKWGNKYTIAEPGAGIRHLSRKSLLEGWVNSVMLLLEPDPVRFSAQPDERDKMGRLDRFLKRIWPHRVLLAQVFLFSSVLGVLSLLSPLLFQVLTDNVLAQGDTQLLTGVAIAVCLMYLVSGGLELAQSHLVAYFGQRVELGLTLEFVRQILRLPLSYYETHRTGEVLSRREDIQQINQFIARIVVHLPSQLLIAAVSLVLMFFYSLPLTVITLMIAVAMMLPTLILLPTLQQKVRSVLVLDAEIGSILVETFKGALTCKTLASEGTLWDELLNRFGRLAHQTFRTTQISIISNVSSDFVERVGSVILLWMGSTLVVAGDLRVGQLLAIYALKSNFTSLMTTLVESVSEFIRVQAAIQRLTDVIDLKPEGEDNYKKPFVAIPSNADLVCTHLSFHHPGSVDILKDLTLTLPGGKVIAICGPSGCGKSSLAKLIAGLYTPNLGNIRIGGYNQKDLSLECWRQQVKLVSQEAEFFSRSIVENFRLGSPFVKFEQILQAAEITGADAFISQLPDRYQTILGEFGCTLSGGQKQKLAIARAIINEPPVLILDESTSHLDLESKEFLLKNLLAHRRGKTTILISHDESVNAHADFVFTLDKP